MSAATSPLRSSASSVPRSPSGISASGSSGSKPLRNSAAPLTDSEPVVRPWKPWSQKRTRFLPVAYRANFSAVSTDSVPLLPK